MWRNRAIRNTLVLATTMAMGSMPVAAVAYGASQADPPTASPHASTSATAATASPRLSTPVTAPTVSTPGHARASTPAHGSRGTTAPTTTGAPRAGTKPLADTNTVGIAKEAEVDGGGPLTPGKDVTYHLTARCSGLTEGCVNETVTDTLPADLEVTSLPKSNSIYTVTFDPATRLLTITFIQNLVNPAGSKGLPDGGVATIDVGMRLSANTQLVDGSSVKNTAGVDADNAPAATDSVSTPVSVPSIITPVTTKSWSGGSAVAQSQEPSTVTLTTKNSSSTSAQVTSLTVQDAEAATFEDFDFTGATVSTFPKGADNAQLLVCDKPLSACTDGDYQPGPVLSSTGPLALPAGVSPADVTGVRVRFSQSNGAVLPGPDTTGGGSVALGVTLRDTVRSTGDPLEPVTTSTVRNCAATTAVDTVSGATTGAPACATYDILPNLVKLGTAKSFFPDTNHDYTQGSNEYAVLGQDSPVSALITGTNNSAFSLQTMTITEPSATSVSELEKVDISSVRLTFPTGATQGVLSVLCRDGSTPADATFTSSQSSVDTGCPAGSPPQRITVSYTGTIAKGATATLGVTGNLNSKVDQSDVPDKANPGAGVVDCADVTALRSGTDTGGATGTACRTLPIQLPKTAGPGVKTVSQTSVPPGQPIDFALALTNNGNVDLVAPGISDPQVDGVGQPVAPNPFTSLRITAIDAPKTVGGVAVTTQLFDPAAGGWVPFNANDTALLSRATGVRALVKGSLAPGRSIKLTIHTLRRDGVPDNISITNCATTIGSDGTRAPGIDPWCSPTISTGPADAAASLQKAISPTTLVHPVPGSPSQTAQVRLTLANTGNLNLKRLVASDTDQRFFDGVDFVKVDGVTFPLGADRVQLDACTSAPDCAAGVFTNGVPTSSSTPALPTGVTAANVRGVRVTFTASSTANGGYLLTPGSNVSGAACRGSNICFSVAPRQTLASTGAAVPDSLPDTASAGLESQLQPPGVLAPIPPSSATLTLTQGSPQISFDKGPSSAVGPGEPAPFTLTVRNTGSANVPNLHVADPIPAGLVFDDTYAGSTVDGKVVPYKVSITGLPAGVSPTDPVFTTTVNGPSITEVDWNFGAWNLPPGATIEIQFQTTLAPGNHAGQKIVNKAGATSPIDALTCRDAAKDPAFLDGSYCTHTATVTTKAGAAFNAKKWVAGNPDLGWYNTVSAQPVTVGGATCPSFTVQARSYTAYPCIALVNPGDQFRYALQLVNAGTESATQMRVIDKFPVKGDTGVVLDGQERGTQWANRPTLASVPTLVSAPAGTTLTNSFTNGPVCAADLDLTEATMCPPGSWADGFSSANSGAKMSLRFGPSLAPGAGVTMTFAMATPLDVPQVSDPTIAWNSFGHAESTVRADGSTRNLPPTEPLKVGVATAYGQLRLAKTIGDNPAGLPVDGVDFLFHATCVITPLGGPARTVLDRDYPVSSTTPVEVPNLPAGAKCGVYEADAHGGVSSHPKSNPMQVTIGSSLTGGSAIATATISNSFPASVLALDKVVNGGAGATYGTGPFTIQVTCSYAGQLVSGFPKVATFDGAGSQRIDGVPTGATCSAVETVNGAATSVSYDPASTGNGSGSVVTSADAPQTITVTNTFDAGNLVVDKSLQGAGAPQLSNGPFTFTVACTFNGRSYDPGTITIRGDAKDTTIVSSPMTGLPIGARCVVTETDNGGADATPPPVAVTITAGPARDGLPPDTAAAAFVNTFSAGTLTVDKVLTGTAADQPWATNATFTVQLTCQIETTDAQGDPIRGTLYSGAIKVKGGATVTVTDPAGNPLKLPVGAHCWGTETDTGDATSSVVDHNSWDTAAVITPQDPPSQLQQLTVTATNTFDSAEVVVSKKVVGEGSPGPYTFALACTMPDPGNARRPVTLRPEDAAFSLSSGQEHHAVVPQGANCASSETVPPADAAVSIIDSDPSTPGGTSDGVVDHVRGVATIAFTNTFATTPPTSPPPTTGPPTTGPPTSPPPTTGPPTSPPPTSTPPTTGPPTTAPPTTGPPTPAPPTTGPPVITDGRSGGPSGSGWVVGLGVLAVAAAAGAVLLGRGRKVGRH